MSGSTQSSEELLCANDSAEVECPICYQEYNQGSKCPRMLECLHVFCTECLRNIQLSPLNLPDPQTPTCISCPLCRHPTHLEDGDTHSLPCNSRILARLPPLAFRMPVSVTTRLATVTQRVVLSLEARDARFIILPTVSLRVEQMGERESLPSPTSSGAFRGEVEVLHRHRRTLLCVQLMAVLFWILFVFTCVMGVVFGPSFFHN
ncbi:RING finger protein 222 [Chanos chanos]|uniref:RING finger protein 222 n=1 Tax=Chanos chanos TaxID=29144 RepID=A0A6J2VTF8_CHACN|nr:RING finger protein 222-like [Chanos chanos]